MAKELMAEKAAKKVKDIKKNLSVEKYLRGQFSVVRLGTFAAALSSGPNSQSIQAANEALSGVNNVPSYRSFCSLSHANYGAYNSYTVIGNQVYYN